jgi:hypothetical protein
MYSSALRDIVFPVLAALAFIEDSLESVDVLGICTA